MVCVVLYKSLTANAIQKGSEKCKNSKNMETVRIYNVQREPTNVCQLSQWPEANLWMGDDSAVEVPEWTCGHHNDWLQNNFVFLEKKPMCRKGHTYSNESASLFLKNTGMLVNSINLFCIMFMYHEC